MTLQSGTVAILVDGENFSARQATRLLEIAGAFGAPNARRVYGNESQIRAWDEHGFRLCPTRPGMNSADMLLCVQAMTPVQRDGFATVVIAT